jgi:hypothetical protein
VNAYPEFHSGRVPPRGWHRPSVDFVYTDQPQQMQGFFKWLSFSPKCGAISTKDAESSAGNGRNFHSSVRLRMPGTWPLTSHGFKPAKPRGFSSRLARGIRVRKIIGHHLTIRSPPNDKFVRSSRDRHRLPLPCGRRSHRVGTTLRTPCDPDLPAGDLLSARQGCTGTCECPGTHVPGSTNCSFRLTVSRTGEPVASVAGLS